MNRVDIASRIEHTNLKPDATEEAVVKLCQEAKENGFHGVCVNPCRVHVAASALRGAGIQVCSVVGFPLGAHTSRLKATEAGEAITNGATEIDMVMNIGWFKEGNRILAEQDIRAVRTAISENTILKVIIEAAVLSQREKCDAAKLVVHAGGNFVKTSTGFHPAGGATVKDVKLLKSVVGNDAKIKAAGGIRDARTVLQMIGAGADRIGTSSSVAIMGEIPNDRPVAG
ncbi:MAG: deoxyribose-phosphate aldolase [candidate division NC10 bacterium]|nr:deoxyribose-phosphate aldolase [candidate division NC10 bacterium]